jgi:hypothetical protein
VAWTYGETIQVGVIDSHNAERAWIYSLIPPGRQTSRLVKPLHELTLVVAGDELHPVLARQAQTALARRHART